MAARWLLALTLAGYGVGAALFVAALYRRRWARWAQWATVAGFAGQTGWLLVATVRPPPAPAWVTVFGWLQCLGWLSVGGYLAWRRLAGRRQPADDEDAGDRLGGFLLTLVVALLTAGLALERLRGPALVLPGGPAAWMVAVHVAATLAASAAFLGSVVWAIMFTEKERELRHKRPRVFYYELPALDAMDRWSGRLAAAGWGLWSLALAAGVVAAKSVWGQYWNGDAKEWWSLLVWLAYGAYLALRWRSRWRGHRAAVWNMVAFFLIVANVFGINAWFAGLHEFSR